MKVYHTAALTAVWRKMAKVDDEAIRQVGVLLRVLGYLLGLLDPNSVGTIAQRTMTIDSLIRKLKPNCIVEIGAGFSSRQNRFSGIKCYELDLPYFTHIKNSIIAFDIAKDKLNLADLGIKNALFIVEGVTMYLQESQVVNLLKQIKNYKGHLVIDFFSKEHSNKHKNLREKIYKLIFKRIINSDRLFDYRIKNIEEGKFLLKKLGYKSIRHYPYNVPKTLDALFYCRL